MVQLISQGATPAVSQLCPCCTFAYHCPILLTHTPKLMHGGLSLLCLAGMQWLHHQRSQAMSCCSLLPTLESMDADAILAQFKHSQQARTASASNRIPAWRRDSTAQVRPTGNPHAVAFEVLGWLRTIVG